MSWDPHHYTGLPDEVIGTPSRTYLAEVLTVNSDGTIDARPLKSRATKVSVPVPTWYVPTVGDRVVLADLDGIRQTPICITPFGPEDGSQTAPSVRSTPPAGSVGVTQFAQLPQARVVQTGAGGSVANPIPNGSFGVLTFNSSASPRYDITPSGAAQHSNVTNPSRLTCVVAGLYDIGGQTSTGVALGSAHVNLVLNGATTIGIGPRIGPVSPMEMVVSAPWRLGVGDYVEMWLGNNTGGAVTVPAGSEFWWSWRSP